MSFWVVPLMLLDALGLGRRDVEGEQDRRRGVDGHRGADVAQRQPVEEDRHVGQAADRHADPADLAFGCGGVRVVAHLGRKVEGDRQARLAVVEQVAETSVGLLGRGEPGVLTHRPEPAAVHGRLDAPGERELSGRPRSRSSSRSLMSAGVYRCRVSMPDDVANGSRRSAADATALARTVSRHRSRAGSSPSPTSRRRRSVASVMASLEDDEHVAELDRRPCGRRHPRDRARPWRAPSFCIFIASTASRVWPASTRSPGLTATDATLPG